MTKCENVNGVGGISVFMTVLLWNLCSVCFSLWIKTNVIRCPSPSYRVFFFQSLQHLTALPQVVSELNDLLLHCLLLRLPLQPCSFAGFFFGLHLLLGFIQSSLQARLFFEALLEPTLVTIKANMEEFISFYRNQSEDLLIPQHWCLHHSLSSQ